MNLARRSYSTCGVCLLAAGLTAVLPLAPSSVNLAPQAIRLLSSSPANDLVGLVVGGTGTPIPQESVKFPNYVEQANDLFIQRILPGAVSQGVFTPEGGSPIYTGVKSLPFDTSFAQGAAMLKIDIENSVAAGNTVAVYGESQSSTISGMVMPELEHDGVAADAVKFVLVGNPSNPDGGLLERFAPLSLPALGITFDGATPPDSIYHTDIYTQEYDGFADFPKFTLNALADINAVLGLLFVHPTYRVLTETQLDHAIALPTTADYNGNTTYYMVPMADDQVLPLLRLFEGIPLVGKPLVDLINPVLTQIVNLGYDNPQNQGWDVGQANVPTTFGLFPSIGQVMTAIDNMGPALQQGFEAFANDLTHPAATADSSETAAALTNLFGLGGAGLSLPNLTDVVNGLTAAFSQAYSILLPTADIATSLAVSMPAYDLNLFAQNLLSDPLQAIVGPLAADTGLITLAAGIELMTVEQTLTTIAGDVAGMF